MTELLIVVSVLVILATFWLDVYLSRSWMAFALIIALILELTARGAMSLYVGRRQARRSLLLRTLILGSGERATELMEELDRPGSGFLPLGYIDAGSPLITSADMSPADQVEKLREIFRGYALDCVFVASSTIGVGQMVALTRAARLEGIIVRVYTHLSGILPSRVTVQHLGKDGVALTLKPTGLSAGQRIVKRGWISSVRRRADRRLPHPAGCGPRHQGHVQGQPCSVQERVTEGGRTFWMYKFRTMTLPSDPTGRVRPGHVRPFFKLEDDPASPLGKRLRKWSLDELPSCSTCFAAR
jgi:hypothetical protein